MKTFRHILSYLQAALLIGLTAACHDDIQSPNNSPDVDFATGITLRIPNLSRAADFARTRGESETGGQDANIIENEGKISNNDLHLYIFPTAETGGNPIHVQLGDKNTFGNAYQDLPCLDENGNKIYAGIIATENNTETYYHIPMIPGKYKLYVLGNLKEYNENLVLDKNLTEDAIKGITLKFDGPLQAGHLPMLCLPEDVDGANNNGEFDVLQKDLTSLACNLRFQCAKVRYTVLFDNTPAEGSTEAGFSNPQFGANHFLDFEGATVSNIASGINLLDANYEGNHISDSAGIDLTASEWPAGDPFDKYNAEGTAYPGTGTNDKGVATPGLNEHNSKWTDNDRRRAWQGIVYLPENKKTDARTTLHLAGLVDGASDNPYEVPLIKDPTGTKTSTLDRGKFYDLTLLATSLQTTELKFVINPFTTQQLIYDLQGPVYLNVEETNITVSAGSETSFSYSTNGQIDFYSPKWHDPDTGKDLNFYEIRFSEGKVIVTINSEIPASELKIIEADPNLKSQYMFFHLTSGNIHKKITVVPLQLKSFLMVDPEEITIDVREQIASGKYSGTIENGGAFKITVRTNLPEYTVTAENWKVLVPQTGDNTSNLLYIADENGNKIEFGQPRRVSNGRETLYLVYDRLNAGEKFWADDPHTMNLTFTVDDEDVMPDYIDIKTRPSNDNYIIHMKGPSDMTDPHIYVYQCLEIPGWFNLNGDYKYANQPIGYKSDDNDTDRFAALEYSFTGRVSFLGWQETSNANLLNSINSTWGKDKGFYIMQELALDNGTTSSTHYNLDYDFFYDYRYGKDEDGNYLCACDQCRSDIKKVWPGIRMKSEGGNWWKIELTGVATPGKALIMFANTHDGASPRYPKHEAVGVPLFDYPNREGWIDLSQGDLDTGTYAFTSENLQETQKTPTSGRQKFRVIWYENYSQINYDRIRMISPVSGDNLYPMGRLDPNKPYYEFTMDLDHPQTIKWQLYKVGAIYAESREFTAEVGDFEWNASSRTFELKNHCHF